MCNFPERIVGHIFIVEKDDGFVFLQSFFLRNCLNVLETEGLWNFRIGQLWHDKAFCVAAISLKIWKHLWGRSRVIFIYLRPSADEQFLQAILWYCDNFLTKYCFCFSKSAEITMCQNFQLTRWRKILLEKCLFVLLSHCLFIAILLVKIACLTRA